MWVTAQEVGSSFFILTLVQNTLFLLSYAINENIAVILFHLQTLLTILMNTRTTGKRYCYYEYFASDFPTELPK